MLKIEGGYKIRTPDGQPIASFPLFSSLSPPYPLQFVENESLADIGDAGMNAQPRTKRKSDKSAAVNPLAFLIPKPIDLLPCASFCKSALLQVKMKPSISCVFSTRRQFLRTLTRDHRSASLVWFLSLLLKEKTPLHRKFCSISICPQFHCLSLSFFYIYASQVHLAMTYRG